MSARTLKLNAYEVDDLRHLDLGEDTTGLVVSQVARITDREGVRALDRDLARLAAVELLHALDLGESDKVSVFETMTRLVEAGYEALAILVNGDDHASQGLLAGRVDTSELRAEVIEC